ncbi:MAG: pseudouridine synthase [Syntrophobacteraceae bacterium]
MMNERPSSSFKWQARLGERSLKLAEVVSAYLRISEEEATDLVDFGSVHVRGRLERKPSRMLSGGEEISVTFPPYGVRRFYETDPSRVIYRDRTLLAYDKEAGIPSQQTPYDAYNNIFAALLRYLPGKGSSAPYAALHHRLDRETSGLMLFALDKGANNALGRAFQEKDVKKDYLAWVEGSPETDSWSCDSEIAKTGSRYRAVRKGEGKKACTIFRVLYREESRSLVLAGPMTGRTHQIRIHLAESGRPIVGDRAYGAKPAARLFLHAWRLVLKHPSTGKALSLEAPVPPEWEMPGRAGSLLPA